MAETSEHRRPLKVRDFQFLHGIAATLAKANVTPNQISIISVVFAALAGVCIMGVTSFSGFMSFFFMILTMVGLLGRVLCNLFDGMVAVEQGKATPSGELFNDVPDRLADFIIFVGAGYAVSATGWGPLLGWSAAVLAITTAYARTLGRSLGAPTDFRGPMAKPHRMGVLAVCVFLTPFEGVMFKTGTLLMFGLFVICVGSALTVARRVRGAYSFLELRVLEKERQEFQEKKAAREAEKEKREAEKEQANHKDPEQVETSTEGNA